MFDEATELPEGWTMTNLGELGGWSNLQLLALNIKSFVNTSRLAFFTTKKFTTGFYSTRQALTVSPLPQANIRPSALIATKVLPSTSSEYSSQVEIA